MYLAINVIGLLIFLAIGWIFSKDRKAINWKAVLIMVVFNLVLAWFLTSFPIGRMIVKGAAAGFDQLVQVAYEGIAFAFPSMVKVKQMDFFFSVLMPILLIVPLFDILEYIQYRQMKPPYQIGFLIWANRILVMPFCSLCLGWSLIRFLGLQKTNFKIFIVFVVLLISYTIFMMPWCMIPLLQWTLPWPTYVNIISIIISEIDFLPAYFVIIGIGLAYFRKGKTDKSLSTEQTDE